MIDWVELLELHRRAEEGDAEACNRLGEILLKSAPVEIRELHESQESADRLEERLDHLFADLDRVCELGPDSRRQKELETQISYMRTQIRATVIGAQAALREHRNWRERSLREAFFYFELSARLGDAEGMWNTGWRYWLSEGVERNESMATFWWVQAAARGHSSAVAKLFTIVLQKEEEHRRLEQTIRREAPRLRRDPLNLPGKRLEALSVFLCHSSSDKESVRGLRERLEKSGFNTWLDEENLTAGEEWEAAIKKAIDAADVAIVCLSSEAIKKVGFVQNEIEMTLEASRRRPEGSIFIVPVLLEPVKIPDKLRRWHYVKLYEERGYDQLTAGLRSRAKILQL